MQKIHLLLILILAPLLLWAQQDPLSTQYMLNPMVINPAHAGLGNNLNALVSYRTQWTGLEGQPQTINASGNISLADNRVGTGLTLMRDKIGSTTTVELNAAFSYKLILRHEKVLSFGLHGGFINFRNDYNTLSIYDYDDPAFTGGERGTKVNLGAGVILKSERYLVGLSVPRLIPATFTYGGQAFDIYNQHLYVYGAYVWYLNERTRFKPTVLLRAVKGAPASVDLGANVTFNALHTVGIFTRNFTTYGLMMQTLLADKFRLGYVFELPTGKSVGPNFSSHEVLLGVRLSVFDFHEKGLSNF